MIHKEFLKSLSNFNKVTQDNKETMMKDQDNEGYDKWIEMMKEHDKMNIHDKEKRWVTWKQK